MPVELAVDFDEPVAVELEFQASWRRDVVGKATPGRGGPGEPRWSLGT